MASTSIPAATQSSPTPRPTASPLTTLDRLAVPRAVHSATLLPDGRVLLAGGLAREGSRRTFHDSAELFDPASGRFTPTGRMTARRAGHLATLLPNGQVLITGGANEVALASAELYDPAAGTFAATSTMTLARGGYTRFGAHTATLLPNGTVLITGGYNGEWPASAEVYDPATGRFTTTGDMTTARSAHGAVLLPDGTVLVAGGSDRTTAHASAEVFDPKTGRFRPTGGMTVGRHKLALVALADGRVLVTGGADVDDQRVASAEVYDPDNGRFSPTADMGFTRYKHTWSTVLLADGTALIANGADTLERYDPKQGRFIAEGRLDEARFYSGVARLRDGSVLIAGGYSEHTISTDQAWLYRP